MLTAPSTTIGLAGSARPSLEIDYALPGNHLPVQQHRVEQLAVLRKKHAKPRLDEYSKRVIPKTAAARRRAIEECAESVIPVLLYTNTMSSISICPC